MARTSAASWGSLTSRASVASGGEVLDAADAGAGLVQAGGDGVAAPAEAALGGAGAAAAQGVGDLGLEEAALVALEAAGRRTDQALVLLRSRRSCGSPSAMLRESLRAALAPDKPLTR